MEMITVYRASDGRQFEKEAECAAYEEVIEFGRAVEMAPADIQAALSGADPGLGDILEKLGNRIAKHRIDRGGAKRRPRAQEAQP